MKKLALVLGLAVFMALILPVNLGAYAFVADKPIQRISNDASFNWAGYYVKGSGIGYATATWVVPSVVNTVSGYSSAWVGIGGVYGTQYLIQTGTEQDCSTSTTTGGEVRFHGPVIADKPSTTGGGKSGGGSTTCNPIYYAWWETYPANAEQKITTITVSPNDVMNAVLQQTSSGVWTITLTDTTNLQSFTTSVNFTPDQTTAESIIERPALCFVTCKLTNLADFQTMNFQQSAAGATSSSSVTFDADPSHTIIYMVDNSGRIMAAPGTLSSPGAFPVTWLRSN